MFTELHIKVQILPEEKMFKISRCCQLTRTQLGTRVSTQICALMVRMDGSRRQGLDCEDFTEVETTCISIDLFRALSGRRLCAWGAVQSNLYDFLTRMHLFRNV